MPPSIRPVSRRTTFAAAPLVVLAACRWGPEEDEPAAPQETAAPSIPDEDQVHSAWTEIASVQSFAQNVAAAHPGLSQPLAELVDMHANHLDLLALDGSTAPEGDSAPQRSATALRSVRRRERALQDSLTDLAGSVSSGELARTLASMAAAVAQQVHLLPQPTKGAKP